MKGGVKTEVSLKRALGLSTSTLLVVGLLIGSGVFKKIIPMAQTGMGETAILMAWLVAGIISLFGAITVGGLASLTEESGGTYEYLQLSFGKFFGFLSGWADFMIMGPGSLAALAYLFAQIVNSIIPIPNPLQSLENISIANFIFPFADSGVKMVGISAIVALNGINYFGARESGIINNIITAVKIIGILILIYLGITYVRPEMAAEPLVVTIVGPRDGMIFLSAFLTSMLGAFWAYSGWDNATNISGEIINPKRNVPLAIAFGILIVMVIYILVNFAYMNVLPLEILRTVGKDEIGALVVAKTLMGSSGNILLTVLIVICVFGCLNSNIVAIPRRYFRMAEQGYFFKNVKRVHPRFRTPYMALTYTMIWSSILLLSGSFDMLTDMVIFASFIFYGFLAIGLLKLKRKGTIKVKVVGYPVVPIIYLAFSVAFCINTFCAQPKQSLLGILLILSGVPFYYYFNKKNLNQVTFNQK
jgi:basic amino acid/polyamine antiporter, APA family